MKDIEIKESKVLLEVSCIKEQMARETAQDPNYIISG